MTSKMVISKGGSEQLSAYTQQTKARMVEINKDKAIGRMNKLGRMFRLYWMGNIPQIIGRKKHWVKYKNLVKQALSTSK